MKFGPTALAEAEGAILAHTLRLASGRVLRKGRRLAAADLEALRADGRREVTVARLEADDVHEDEAATALGRALLGPGLRLDAASTGRCNARAEARGLLRLDVERIDRVNAVDEALTVATAPPWALLEPRELALTVKVIPFAVPAAQLAACVEAARGASPAAALAAFRPQRAGLVLTHVPGLAPAVLARAAQSQRTRLARLGSAVAREIRCPHEEAALAEAIASLVASGCSPILILGASAVVDRRDVVPAALERAGGRVDHLGMPVDPGNLLLLGHHGATPVVGLPGCARSLKPSGADRVLQRIAAGVPVTGADLARMGAGGLLKEIPSRPQPRESAPDEDEEQPPQPPPAAAKPRIGAVVLAAGRSQRMGRTNKLLAPLAGVPMIARVVDAVLGSSLRPVVVVTGHEAQRVRAALGARDLRCVHNAAWAEGLGSSVRAGVAALAGAVDGVAICLGDMPWVRAEHLDALAAAFDPSGPRPICAPVHEGRRGNPVLWPARHFAALTRLSGDTGARLLLDACADEITPVPIADDGVLLDVDTPSALAQLDPAVAPDPAGVP